MGGELSNVIDNALDAQGFEKLALSSQRVIQKSMCARERGKGKDNGLPFDMEQVIVVAQLDLVVVLVERRGGAFVQPLVIQPGANLRVIGNGEVGLAVQARAVSLSDCINVDGQVLARDGAVFDVANTLASVSPGQREIQVLLEYDTLARLGFRGAADDKLGARSEPYPLVYNTISIDKTISGHQRRKPTLKQVAFALEEPHAASSSGFRCPLTEEGQKKQLIHDCLLLRFPSMLIALSLLDDAPAACRGFALASVTCIDRPPPPVVQHISFFTLPIPSQQPLAGNHLY